MEDALEGQKTEAMQIQDRGIPGNSTTVTHNMDGLKQQQFILSQFQTLEVHNQGCGQSCAPSRSSVGKSFLASSGFC
jgi:hypothetical protein